MKAITRNGKLYLTSGLSLFNPTEDEVSNFQFAHAAMQAAPNSKILWLQGEFVDGDTPNKNGQEWSSEEISIKSVTANLMPVTIMHDFRTAVGVIADTKLTKDETSSDGVSKAKLSTVLAIWAHRFPDVAREIIHNNDQGTLMQSQECEAPAFECSSCGQVFVKPVDETSFCDHLKNGEASRRLHNVTFTGTGLIFGSRGAEGANPKARLDLMEEVAQWSDTRNGVKRKQETSTMDTIEIKRTEYDELKSRPAREDFDALKAKLDDSEKAVAEAEKTIEAAEVAKKAAEDAKKEVDEELSALKGEVEADELAKERVGAIAEELSSALPESITEKLHKQARSMSDEEWEDRISELSELVKIEVKETEGGKTFSKEEISRFSGQGRKTDPSVDVMSIGKALYKNARGQNTAKA